MSKEALPLEFVKKVKDAINRQENIVGEIQKTTTDGQVHWIQNSIMPIYDDNNNQIGEVIVNYDITDKKTFEKLAVTDGLTDLYNRRFFNDILAREISRATRDKTNLSFLILDIDFFKKYNDSYGHDAGDKALISVAKSISTSLQRGSDFAFRLGGEEFGVLFSECGVEDSLKIANKIRENIEALQIEHTNSKISNHITVSAGLLVVDFSRESVDANGFYTMADDALYQAKENGRNNVILYQNEDVVFF